MQDHEGLRAVGPLVSLAKYHNPKTKTPYVLGVMEMARAGKGAEPATLHPYELRGSVRG